MDFEFLFALMGFVLGVIAIGIFVRNKNSLAFRSFLFFDLFALVIPSLIYLVLSLTNALTPPLNVNMWTIGALIDYLGFVILYYFILQHHPTSQLNARKTTFYLLLTILLIFSIFGSQIEINLQGEGFEIITGLDYFISASFFFSYLSIENISYAAKMLKHARKQNRSTAWALFLGLTLISISFPVAITLATFVFSPPQGNILFLLLGIGVLLLAFVLEADQSIPFLIPSQILELGVFDKSGRELFYYRFQETVAPTQMRPGIIIGLQTLLSNLVSESKSPRGGEIEEIKLKDRFILFDYSMRYEFFVIIILTSLLASIKTIIKTFLREFEKKFDPILKNLHQMPAPVDSENFKEAASIIERIFAPSK